MPAYKSGGLSAGEAGTYGGGGRQSLFAAGVQAAVGPPKYDINMSYRRLWPGPTFAVLATGALAAFRERFFIGPVAIGHAPAPPAVLPSIHFHHATGL